MKINLLKATVSVFAAAAISLVPAVAAPYSDGQRIASFQAKDQFDNAFTFKPADFHFLLVSHDMETGKKANAVLSPLGKDFLASKKAVYVANINGMPGIGRMFAMPKMKKYNHRIILADDEALIAKFPEQPGKVTVLTISNEKVQAISYWTPGVEKLETVLK